MERHEEIESKIQCQHGILLSVKACVPEGYPKGEVPKKPTDVVTRFEINNIREINDKEMRITVDYYQELIWTDDRIKTKLSKEDDILVLNNHLICFEKDNKYMCCDDDSITTATKILYYNTMKNILMMTANMFITVTA